MPPPDAGGAGRLPCCIEFAALLASPGGAPTLDLVVVTSAGFVVDAAPPEVEALPPVAAEPIALPTPSARTTSSALFAAFSNFSRPPILPLTLPILSSIVLNATAAFLRLSESSANFGSTALLDNSFCACRAAISSLRFLPVPKASEKFLEIKP